MEAFFALLAIPLLILNMLGGIISGVWLLLIGDWKLLMLGLAILFVGNFVVTIALLPAMALGVPGVALFEGGGIKRIISYPFLYAGLIWTYIIMSAWGLGIFLLFMKSADSRNWIPLLIWSYGIAIGQWSYMASKERGSVEISSMAALFMQVAYVVLMVMIAFFKTSILSAMIGFLIVMGLCLVLNVIYSALTMKIEPDPALFESEFE